MHMFTSTYIRLKYVVMSPIVSFPRMFLRTIQSFYRGSEKLVEGKRRKAEEQHRQGRHQAGKEKGGAERKDRRERRQKKRKGRRGRES